MLIVRRAKKCFLPVNQCVDFIGFFQPSWCVTVAIKVNSAMTTCVTVEAGVVNKYVLCLSISLPVVIACAVFCYFMTPKRND